MVPAPQWLPRIDSVLPKLVLMESRDRISLFLHLPRLARVFYLVALRRAPSITSRPLTQ